MKTKPDKKRDAAIIFKADEDTKRAFAQKASKFGGMTAVLLNFVNEFVKNEDKTNEPVGV